MLWVGRAPALKLAPLLSLPAHVCETPGGLWADRPSIVRAVHSRMRASRIPLFTAAGGHGPNRGCLGFAQFSGSWGLSASRNVRSRACAKRSMSVSRLFFHVLSRGSCRRGYNSGRRKRGRTPRGPWHGGLRNWALLDVPPLPDGARAARCQADDQRGLRRRCAPCGLPGWIGPVLQAPAESWREK
jgi:hypothetical protein